MHQNVIFHKPSPILMCITLWQIAVLISHLTRSVPQWRSFWRQTKLTWRATDTRWEYSHKSAEVHVRRCMVVIYILRPRQNGRHFPDDILKWIFLNEKLWISITIPLKFVPRGSINNIPVLVRIIAWRRPGDKPLCKPTLVSFLTNICVTWPQWVNMALAYGFLVYWRLFPNRANHKWWHKWWLHIIQLYRM